MFSERLADVSAQCNADLDKGITDSPFCINEEFRTETGGGSFDPFDNTSGKIEFINQNLLNLFKDGCFKNGIGDHHSKDGCCGEYPDRLPYDSMSRECCRMSTGVSFFDTLVPFGECDMRGGDLAPVEE